MANTSTRPNRTTRTTPTSVAARRARIAALIVEREISLARGSGAATCR